MRKDQWQRHFWAEIDRQRSMPFGYGVRDCVLFAATMADVITINGEYESRARAAFQWTSEREALKLIASGLRQPVETVLGPMIPWPMLSMGDIVLIVDDKERECCAIHDGATIIMPDQIGLRSVPFRCARGGWLVQ